MRRILIVDDDEQVVKHLSGILVDFDFEIEFLLEGEFLFQRLAQNKIDLILLDIYMPRINGLDLLKELKRHKTHKNIPVIVLTGDDNPQIMYESFEAGVVGFIKKPVQKLEIMFRVQMACVLAENFNNVQELLKLQEQLNDQLIQANLELKAAKEKEQEISNFLTSLFYLILQNQDITSTKCLLASNSEFNLLLTS
ncbi:response regulator [Deltaproteobacteria bacterium TL4]